jgi:hypothetical protein
MLLMAAGPVKSAVGVGAYVAAQTVTVPMAGFWGYFGYTAQVSLSVMYPFLIPLIAASGATVVGASMALYFRCKHFWELTSTKLNTEFWQNFVAKSMMVHKEQQNQVDKRKNRILPYTLPNKKKQKNLSTTEMWQNTK